MSKSSRAKWGSKEWLEQRRRAGEVGGKTTKERQLAKNPNYYKDLARLSAEARAKKDNQ